MKKLKLISLVCVALCLVLLCTSCGKKVEPAAISDYLNTDYAPEKEPVLSSYTYLSELDGYEIIDQNSHFVVFAKTIYPDLAINPTALPSVSYKILSLDTAAIIANISGAESLTAFRLYEEAPIILAATSKLNATNFSSLVESGIDSIFSTITDEDEYESSLVPENALSTNYIAYDATGSVLSNTKKVPAEPTLFADLVIFNYAAYELNENTGALTKTADVNEFMMLDDCLGWNDSYYYATNQSGTELYVYDTEFKLVYTWSAPGYVNNYSCFINVLNDGNILIQYLYSLDSDASKYDAYYTSDGLTEKYDLVSLIFSVEDGSVEEKNLDYIVYNVSTNYALNADAKEDNAKFTDTFENIAYIYPIVDKKFDYSAANGDMVLMSNDLKFEKSLKIVENQGMDYAYMIDKDLYAITMLDGGIVLVDGEGTVVNKVNNFNFEITNDYIIGEAAIYNFDLTKAYDLMANNAEIVDDAYMSDGILIKAVTDTGYNMLILKNGAIKPLYTYNRNELTPTTFFGYGENYYRIQKVTTDALTGKVTNNYTYYNVDGTAFLTSQIRLAFESSSIDNDVVLVSGYNEQSTDVYFIFK